MGLAGEEEHHGTLRVVDNLLQALQVGEQQVCALVGGEAAAEADDQSVGVEFLHQADDALGVALVLQPCLAELLYDIVEELRAQCLARLPYLLVGTVVDAVPDFLVRLVGHEVLVEVLGIELPPFCSAPCWEVYTVGDIAHVVLLGIVALPDA